MTFFTTHEIRATRPRLHQVLSGLFIVLYVMASLRGLVPGLCLNLTAPSELVTNLQGTACIEAASGSCCMALDENESGPGSTPETPKRCPFCRLALGLTETPEFVYFQPLTTSGFRPIFAYPVDGKPSPIDRSCAGRGPPQELLA